MYNGPPDRAALYFSQFDMRIPQFCNPADKLSIAAAQPRTMMRKDITLMELSEACKTQLKENLELGTFHDYSYLNRKFTAMEADKQVSFFKQIWLLFNRNMLTALRNPLQLLAVVLLGFIQSFFLSSLFHGAGDAHITYDIDHDRQVITNWIGMVFLSLSDQFIIVSFGMVLLIPLAYPVYKREMGSHMYTAASYYWASTFANLCIYFFYPLVVSALTFPFYKFRGTGFNEYLNWLFISCMMALAGLCYG